MPWGVVNKSSSCARAASAKDAAGSTSITRDFCFPDAVSSTARVGHSCGAGAVRSDRADVSAEGNRSTGILLRSRAWQRLDSLASAGRLSGQHILARLSHRGTFDWAKRKHFALAVRVFRFLKSSSCDA